MLIVKCICNVYRERLAVVMVVIKFIITRARWDSGSKRFFLEKKLCVLVNTDFVKIVDLAQADYTEHYVERYVITSFPST